MRTAKTLILLALLSSCSKAKNEASTAPQPVVQGIKTQTIGAAPASAFLFDAEHAKSTPTLHAAVSPASGPVLSATLTLKKSSLIDRTFLYSLTLQASSKDIEFSLSALEGLLPARFRLIGDHLQLLLDERYKYESDTVHPERLVHSFKVVNQDQDTVTVEIHQASPLVADFLGKKLKDKSIITSWLRSATSSEDSQYILFETAIETGDGRVAEFMESIFPRELVVPADARPIYADAVLNPLAARFGFLTDDTPIWLDVPGKGRKKGSVASHFLVPEGKTIDWYILPNVPNDLIPIFQSSVEGWNRYSQAMWKRDLVRFKGLLPDGVKIGDPRFNVIRYNSDSAETTGWESAAVDPTTGILSHSVINIPKGRLLVVADSWQSMKYTQRQPQPLPQNSSFVAESEEKAVMAPIPIGTFSEEEFVKRYIKSTIMHEVGHALGLAHNFKGSLAHDPKDPTSPIGSSIMDYLNAEYRVLMFRDLNSSDGPILEYDRQILSVLYNEGKDIAAGDPVLPACSKETPDTTVGIDPFCKQYDTGKDPTETVWQAIDLLRNGSAKLSLTMSFPAALEQIQKSMIEEAKLGKPLPKIQDQLSPIAQALDYYDEQTYSRLANASSWFYAFTANIKEDPAQRARALEALHYVLKQSNFEPGAKTAIDSFTQAYLALWETRAETLTLSPPDHASSRAQLEDEIRNSTQKLEQEHVNYLQFAGIRAMACRPNSPFFVNGGNDLEKEFLLALTEIVSGRYGPLPTKPNTGLRVSAAETLFSCAAIPSGKDAIETAMASLKEENKNATSTEKRVQLQKIYKTLKEGPPKE